MLGATAAGLIAWSVHLMVCLFMDRTLDVSLARTVALAGALLAALQHAPGPPPPFPPPHPEGASETPPTLIANEPAALAELDMFARDLMSKGYGGLAPAHQCGGHPGMLCLHSSVLTTPLCTLQPCYSQPIS